MNGSEVLARTLSGCADHVLFGLMGNANMAFIQSWVDDCHGRYVAAWHENQALAMARGYAKASGRPALVTVTHGPGLTNAVTALTASVRGRTPMVLVTPDIPAGGRGRLQDIEQALVVAPTGAKFIDVKNAADIADAAEEAFSAALDEQRTVVLNIAVSELKREVPSTPARRPGRREHLDQSPDPDSITEAVRLLRQARFPLLIAGRGALSMSSSKTLTELGDQIGALMGTTLPMRGYFHGDPWDVGAVGGYGGDALRQFAGDVDCIISVGASLHPRTTTAGTLFPNVSSTIQVDSDPHALGYLTPITHGVLGSAAPTIQALLEEIRQTGGALTTDARTPAIHKALSGFDPSDTFVDESKDDLIDPRTLLIELDRILPQERTVIVDGGHSTGWPCKYLSSPDEKAFLFSNGDYAAIGLGTGMAVGGAVARPDRYPVLVIGDGSLMMALGDLQTLQRYELPSLVVVLNDNAYGSEVHEAEATGHSAPLSQYRSPDFARIAEALGFRASTVTTVEGASGEARQAVSNGQPTLLNCLIAPNVTGPWIEEFAKEKQVANK